MLFFCLIMYFYLKLHDKPFVINIMLKKNINRVSYIELQGKGAVTLVFLPGIGVGNENYIDFLNSIKEYYNRIFCLDLPSQGSKGSWRIGNIVQNLHEFIQYIDADTKLLHLGGHSAGALAVISAVANYGPDLEEELLSGKYCPEDDLSGILKKFGFATKNENLRKVEKIFLFAPPSSFKNVFPPELASFLGSRSRIFVKGLFNFGVNYPMLIGRLFQNHSYYRYKISNTCCPQYYKLVLSDHVAFTEYILKYKTVFDILAQSDQSFLRNLVENLDRYKTIVQFGSWDWVINSRKNKKPLLESFKLIFSPETMIVYSGVGHFLNSKYSLDLNLNNQLLLNKDMLTRLKLFLNEEC